MRSTCARRTENRPWWRSRTSTRRPRRACSTPGTTSAGSSARRSWRPRSPPPPGSPLPPPLNGFAVPLLANGERIGALVIGRDHRPPQEDTILAEEIARRASAAITNARLHEERRRIAHTLQQSLLPSTLPRIPRVDVGACYLPSGIGTEVGGDLYDVMAMPDGRWLAYVGDVSGKGIQAAAMTGFVRDMIRILVTDGKPVESIFAILNTALFERAEDI